MQKELTRKKMEAAGRINGLTFEMKTKQKKRKRGKDLKKIRTIDK